MSKLKTVDLALPASTEDLAKLEIGNVVYLTGRVHTAREGVYKRAVEERSNVPSGIGTASFHCSPAASVGPNRELTVGAVTATASFRFAKWIDGWLDMSGCNVIIGKGGMSSEIYRDSFVPHKAIYLTTVGYGTGALLGRGIKKVRQAVWSEELGTAQALWIFEVENFGPFLVESDIEGNSLFEQQSKFINPEFERLYAGLKAPALKRYGETDDRKDELI